VSLADRIDRHGVLHCVGRKLGATGTAASIVVDEFAGRWRDGVEQDDEVETPRRRGVDWSPRGWPGLAPSSPGLSAASLPAIPAHSPAVRARTSSARRRRRWSAASDSTVELASASAPAAVCRRRSRRSTDSRLPYSEPSAAGASTWVALRVLGPHDRLPGAADRDRASSDAVDPVDSPAAVVFIGR